MLKSNSYNFIFFGGGCAGLSLLMRMLKSGKFRDKKILLIDKEPKTRNDRTWCFWETGAGFFEDLVCKKWDTISFFSDDFSSSFNIKPYHYKMIRGIDFYEYCFNEVSKHPNVEVVFGSVKEWEYEKDAIVLEIDSNRIHLAGKGTQVFSSIYNGSVPGRKNIRLLQHFKGWVIETSGASFNDSQATIMDFRIPQTHGTSFAYLLPLSKTAALVEYTLLTKELLQPAQYDKELSDYIRSYLGIEEYVIKEEEFGVIPMTNEKRQFPGHGWQIGMAGGQTKASSGYTFQFIQKQSQQITDYLISGKSLNDLPASPARFRFYDNTLLHILYHNKLRSDKIFSDLFRKNKAQRVLKFLDNESSVSDELKIISSLPTWPFLKAAWHQL